MNLLKKISAIIMIIFVFTLVSCNKSSEENKATGDNAQVKSGYSILEKKDMSAGDIKMYSYIINVSENSTKKDVEKMCSEVVDKAKSENKFNAIQILVYDGEYISSGDFMPPLGKYILAPEGDFSKAASISAGDYEKMEVSNQLNSVDWKLRPNKDERDIIGMYSEIFKQESEKNIDGIIKEEDIRKKTAEVLNIEVEKVNNALKNVNNWIWQK